jgi:hypothetical protein
MAAFSLEPSASSIDPENGTFGWLAPANVGKKTPVPFQLSPAGLVAIYDGCAESGMEMMGATSRDEGFIRWLTAELDERATFSPPRGMYMTALGDYVAS